MNKRILILAFLFMAILISGCVPRQEFSHEETGQPQTEEDITQAQQPVVSSKLTDKYLMAFHACDTSTANCNDPRNHKTYIAQSNDGVTWSIIPDYKPHFGSVPDLIVRGNTLYVFNPGTVRRYRIDTDEWEDPVQVTMKHGNGATELFVDPSPVLDENGRIVLFYLIGAIGMDPAQCPGGQPTCTKIFRSATEVEESDGISFIVDPGNRAEVTVAKTASDPDIFKGPDGFVLLVSLGQSVEAFESSTLRGTYNFISGPKDGLLVFLSGGIPAGYYDNATAQFWVYVHRSERNVQVIRRAAHNSLKAQISDSQFSTVMTGSLAGLGSTYIVASPGFEANPFWEAKQEQKNTTKLLHSKSQEPLRIPPFIENNCIGFKINSPNETFTINLIEGGWAHSHWPFGWGRIEKTPGIYDFKDTDDLVKTAQENNILILAEMRPFADWDQGYDPNCKAKEHDYLCKPKDMQAYKKFLSALVERYDGDGESDMPGLQMPIKYWEILSEPDIKEDPYVIFFVGDEKDYLEVLKESYQTIKQVCPDCSILHGGAAGVESEFVSFWDNVFKLGGADYFDIANIHFVGIDIATGRTVSLGDPPTLNVKPFKVLLDKYKIKKPIWVTEAVLKSSSAKSSLQGALSAGASKVFFVGFGVEESAPAGEYSADYNGIAELCPKTS